MTVCFKESNLLYINTLSYHKHQYIPVDHTLELYFVGCHHNCEDCQNKELQVQSSDNCRWLTPLEICAELTDYINIAKSVHILGGEPLEQSPQAISELADLLKELGFGPIILFTGNDIPKEYIKQTTSVFKYIDYVKTGKYDKTLLNINKISDKQTGIVLASLNQKIYKVE